MGFALLQPDVASCGACFRPGSSWCAHEAAFARDAWNTVAACDEPDDPFHIASDTVAQANAMLDRQLAQCHLLRCIFGLLPFRPVSLNPCWLAWNDGTIPQLAQGIYDERRFQDLPILADALEEAGCTNADILVHCRESGDHVQGCWVLDLIG
jgi:hypothetical protein